MTQENVSDKKVAGASYLLSFQAEVQLLTHNAGVLINNYLELKHKYSIVAEQREPPNFSDEDKATIKETIHIVRLGVYKSFKAFNSLRLKDKSAEAEKLKALQKSIISAYSIDQEDLDQYVEVMNDVLVSEVMQDLLKSSAEYLNDIYGK